MSSRRPSSGARVTPTRRVASCILRGRPSRARVSQWAGVEHQRRQSRTAWRATENFCTVSCSPRLHADTCEVQVALVALCSRGSTAAEEALLVLLLLLVATLEQPVLARVTRPPPGDEGQDQAVPDGCTARIAPVHFASVHVTSRPGHATHGSSRTDQTERHFGFELGKKLEKRETRRLSRAKRSDRATRSRAGVDEAVCASARPKLRECGNARLTADQTRRGKPNGYSCVVAGHMQTCTRNLRQYNPMAQARFERCSARPPTAPKSFFAHSRRESALDSAGLPRARACAIRLFLHPSNAALMPIGLFNFLSIQRR